MRMNRPPRLTWGQSLSAANGCPFHSALANRRKSRKPTPPVLRDKTNNFALLNSKMAWSPWPLSAFEGPAQPAPGGKAAASERPGRPADAATAAAAVVNRGVDIPVAPTVPPNAMVVCADQTLVPPFGQLGGGGGDDPPPLGPPPPLK